VNHLTKANLVRAGLASQEDVTSRFLHSRDQYVIDRLLLIDAENLSNDESSGPHLVGHRYVSGLVDIERVARTHVELFARDSIDDDIAFPRRDIDDMETLV
jgi:hypothetical protein